MKPFKMPVRVVLYREGAQVFAHSLEFDLVGDGADAEAAMQNLLDAIATQVHAIDAHKNPASLFTPAPPEIFQKFAEGDAARFTGKLEIDERWVRKIDNLELEGVEAREYTPEPAAT